MKKLLFLFVLLVVSSCGSEIVQNSCFNGVRFNEVINLNNPLFINLQVPSGSASANIGGRDILIIRRNDRYQAFDLTCPKRNCTSKMTFDQLFLNCPCDNDRYSSLNGCPTDTNGQCLNDGSCFALEYNVLQINNASLQISR